MNIQNAPAQPEVDEYTYLNQDFIPDHCEKEYVRKHRASGLAYDVNALIDTARFALENDTSGIPLDRRGIANTLEITSQIATDLIGICEMLEKPKEETEDASSRLASFAEWTGTNATSALLDEQGAPTDELLSYCKAQGLSIDWLFLGGPKGLVMRQNRQAVLVNAQEK